MRLSPGQYPDLPAVYTLTDVCRSELLIEIEGWGLFENGEGRGEKEAALSCCTV